MKAIKINPYVSRRDGVSVVEANGLKDYYNEILCRCIDIVRIEVGSTEYYAVVDDEGLLKDDYKMSVCVHNGEWWLAGIVLIFGVDKTEHDLRSLSMADCINIMNHVVEAICVDGSTHAVLEAR